MVIIVGYKKRVGKDEFYKAVKNLYPDKKVIRVAFADSLKDEVYELILKPNKLEKNILDDDKTKPVMRPFLQWYGTQFKRNPDLKGNPDHWIDRVIEKIEGYTPSVFYRILRKLKLKSSDYYIKGKDTIFIITDCRFLNELNKTKDVLNAISVYVKRDSVLDPNDQHVSEIELDSHLDKFDYMINNDGTLDEYHQKVHALMYKVMRKQE
jgi:hypothetical protein